MSLAAGICERTSMSGTIALSASMPIAPGRSTRGGWTPASTTVDSIPASHGPPSSTRIDAVPELLDHVRRGRRRESLVAIRARRRDGRSDGGKEGASHGMRRNAQRNGRCATRQRRRHVQGPLDDERQRSGPECGREARSRWRP